MSALRVTLLVLGVVLLLFGLLLVVSGPEAASGGLWFIVAGSVIVLAVAFERSRYRSEAADRQYAPPGPGGGDPPEAPIEPRFRPTDEVFVDPTSGHRIRVYLDSRSGERRYRAEA